MRLDWLMWFLPLGWSLDDWFTVFLVRLLEPDRSACAGSDLSRRSEQHGPPGGE